jgi:hypothetical protein
MQEKAQEVTHPVTSHNQKQHRNKPNTKHKNQQTAPEKLCTANRKQQQINKKQHTNLISCNMFNFRCVLKAVYARMGFS